MSSPSKFDLPRPEEIDGLVRKQRIEKRADFMQRFSEEERHTFRRMEIVNPILHKASSRKGVSNEEEVMTLLVSRPHISVTKRLVNDSDSDPQHKLRRRGRNRAQKPGSCAQSGDGILLLVLEVLQRGYKVQNLPRIYS